MGVVRFLSTVIAAVMVASAGASANTQGLTRGPTPGVFRMTRIGTVNLNADGLSLHRVTAITKAETEGVVAGATPVISAFDARQFAAADANSAGRRLPLRPLATGIAAASGIVSRPAPKTPNVPSIPLAPANPHFLGFTGLNDLESETVNANQSIEPPDQGLCAGNGTVMEMVNDAVATYDTSGSGKPTLGPVSLNHLFAVPLTDFLTNPRCYYDVASNTFFMSVTDLGNYPTFSNTSFVLLAVMPAGSGTVTSYAISTVGGGQAGCPCFEDEPLLGADANGIYLSGNEFSFAGGFIGAQIFAVNKADLVSGAAAVGVTLFSGLAIAGNPAASIQPAIPAGGVFESANGGSEYFLSSLDPFYFGDNRIAVWALVRWVTRTSVSSGTPGSPSALEILQQRYARGEIDDATYERMRQQLVGSASSRDSSLPSAS